jgi:hypothetical protein
LGKVRGPSLILTYDPLCSSCSQQPAPVQMLVGVGVGGVGGWKEESKKEVLALRATELGKKALPQRNERMNKRPTTTQSVING